MCLSGNVLRVQGWGLARSRGCWAVTCCLLRAAAPRTRPCLPCPVGDRVSSLAAQPCVLVKGLRTFSLRTVWRLPGLFLWTLSARPCRWDGGCVAKPGFGPQPCPPASSPRNLWLLGPGSASWSGLDCPCTGKCPVPGFPAWSGSPGQRHDLQPPHLARRCWGGRCTSRRVDGTSPLQRHGCAVM